MPSTLPRWVPSAYVGAGLDGHAGLGDFNLALGDQYKPNRQGMWRATHPGRVSTLVKSHRHLGVHPNKVFSAGGTVSTIPWPLQWRLLRLPGVAIWSIFEFLRGLVLYL